MSLDSIADNILQHLWMISWQICVLVIVVWGLCKIFSRTSANFRYWLWCIILLRLCLPGDVFQTDRDNYYIPNSLPVVWEQSQETALQSISFANIEEQSSNSSYVLVNWSLSTIVVSLWSLLALLLGSIVVLRAVYAFAQIKIYPRVKDIAVLRLLEECKKQLKIDRDIEVLLSPKVTDGPFLTGIIFPKIILPKHVVTSWKEHELSPIILHELAHLKRRDLVVNWLQILLQIVYFFHPAVWYINRKIYNERELACDDLAVYCLGGKRKNYTKTMLRVLQESNDVFSAFGAVGLAEKHHFLKTRIVRILDNKYLGYKKMKKLTLFILTLFAVCSIGIFGQQKDSAPENKTQQEKVEVSYVVYTMSSGKKQEVEPDLIFLNGVDLKKQKFFAPGNYNLLVSKKDFKHIFKEIKIASSNKTFDISVSMELSQKQVKLKKKDGEVNVKYKITGDFPKEDPIDPEIISLNGLDVRDQNFTPGAYILEIKQPGYIPVKEPIVINKGQGTFEFERELVTLERTLDVDIKFDCVTKDNSYSIFLRPVSEDKSFKIENGSKIKPNSYMMTIKKPFFFGIEHKLHVWPDDRNFVLSEKLVSRPVTVALEVMYGDRINSSEQIVTLKKGQITHAVKTGLSVKPGNYDLEIYHPRYASEAKSITIFPSNVHTIKERMVESKRSQKHSQLVFQILDRDTEQLVQPLRVLVNNKIYSFDQKFAKNTKISVEIDIHKYKTIKKNFIVKGDQFIVAVEAEKLRKIEFLLRNPSMVLNGIKYQPRFAVDKKELESHNLITERGGVTYYVAYVEKRAQFFTIAIGYKYNVFFISKKNYISVNSSFPNINVPALINHLQLVKQEGIHELFQSMKEIYLLHKSNIATLPEEEFSLLVGYLQSISVSDAGLSAKQMQIIKKLRELK
ncbi:M56 family metallopeptidase [Candidatus Uabimicrobium sp. HlEnr_7]|uniref:M56 family metallopeptidase n=1 Tax=Candidatus Uabimicrobium helgolandensis TaxID=3095367 RepID=UPI003558951E